MLLLLEMRWNWVGKFNSICLMRKWRFWGRNWNFEEGKDWIENRHKLNWDKKVKIIIKKLIKNKNLWKIIKSYFIKS